MFNRMTTNSKGELLLTADGPLIYYAAHKQAIAAYEDKFKELKAVTDEQAQCAKVEELKVQIKNLRLENAELRSALNQIRDIAEDY